ncbi:MAG: hypothetical protein ACJ72A_24450, partial [Nocardioidaceae bacterium]
SHELLAAASARQIVAAFTMLKGLDVHVVVTARDPARQCVAEWQEGIKHGRTLTFEQFRRDVLDDRADTEQAFRYRACQDLPDVLRRWATVVPAANVHVVCCPGPSADRAVLWRRFSEAVGVDPVEFPAAGRDSLNSSLGVDQIDFLRRVNIALDRRLRQPEYGRVVKQYYAQELLAVHSSAAPMVPHDMFDALAVTGKNWVRHVEESGYAVHGVLADLVPSPLVDAVTHPHHLDPAAQVVAAAGTTAELLLELARCHAEVEELTAHGLSLEKRRKKLKKQLKRVTKVPSGR